MKDFELKVELLELQDKSVSDGIFWKLQTKFSDRELQLTIISHSGSQRINHLLFQRFREVQQKIFLIVKTFEKIKIK